MNQLGRRTPFEAEGIGNVQQTPQRQHPSLNNESCSGCSACYNACNIGCISMLPDTEGFIRPSVDTSICSGCGNCIQSCPLTNKPITTNLVPEMVYAAWSLNDSVRYDSTSGGIFSELALHILSKGGSVAGASYNQNNHAVHHRMINTADELHRLRQSKYVQSEVGSVYREIRQALESGKPTLFAGTPCQCAGLSAYLMKDYEKLILCDFICRGANSPKAYLSYLADLENQYQSPIERVWFKNKQNGWNRFGTRIDFQNGQSYYQDRYHDLFMAGYLSLNLFIRPSCHNCLFKGFPRNSDITLADFWGVKIDDETKNPDIGTSLVIINSKKGEELFSKIGDKIYKEEHAFKTALSHNICALESVHPGMHRRYFFDNLDTVPFSDLVNEIALK